MTVQLKKIFSSYSITVLKPLEEETEKPFMPRSLNSSLIMVSKIPGIRLTEETISSKLMRQSSFKSYFRLWWKFEDEFSTISRPSEILFCYFYYFLESGSALIAPRNLFSKGFTSFRVNDFMVTRYATEGGTTCSLIAQI